jgi:hypothetical protein
VQYVFGISFAGLLLAPFSRDTLQLRCLLSMLIWPSIDLPRPKIEYLTFGNNHRNNTRRKTTVIMCTKLFSFAKVLIPLDSVCLACRSHLPPHTPYCQLLYQQRVPLLDSSIRAGAKSYIYNISMIHDHDGMTYRYHKECITITSFLGLYRALFCISWERKKFE